MPSPKNGNSRMQLLLHYIISTHQRLQPVNQTDPPPGHSLPLPLASSRTPCIERIWNTLPPESRKGRVQLLAPVPIHPHGSSGSWGEPGGVLHLAATGDQGFDRRRRLGMPMVQKVRQLSSRKVGAVGAEGCSIG